MNCSRANCVAIRDELRNHVLYSPVGTGKTHLVIALGVAASSRGLWVRFFTGLSF